MFSIAIDGPASSGKSTIAKLIAKKYNLTYIDTGAMYRAITLACLLNKININDPHRLGEILKAVNISFAMEGDQQKVLINGHDVTQEIRSVEVTQNVSKVSANLTVRQTLVQQQQEIARQESVVMDGRDIGTVVLPQASLKFYLVASSHIRAQRRYQENMAKGMKTQSLAEIEAEIIKRDQYDMTRTHSPLQKAEDAIEIDTSNLSIDQVVDQLSDYIDPLQ
ncbi:(d)CMP kinase [Facklamia miroungae]|uniref:Cytidylate kinase n=1 Tax=Facklamia miroungae TaxID=120956 RepID=A0A1G7PL20_9LACT|nr:(d)CMP kinase [Facklamia miroungae]NKZ28755.1 (d)CMP kinase [Facklamia miroungae]SDF87092.1 cytidylate kinase [Facklamia miroungae]